MIKEIYRCQKIFTDIDYFELLLKAYHLYNLDDLDYFALRDLSLKILGEFGCIPVIGVNKASDVDYTIEIIEQFLKERRPFEHVNLMCFNFYDKNREKVLECRIIERPILLEDGEVALFRNKDLGSDDLFCGLKFTLNKTKLSDIHVLPPNFASGIFIWLCHEVKTKQIKRTIEAIEKEFKDKYKLHQSLREWDY